MGKSKRFRFQTPFQALRVVFLSIILIACNFQGPAQQDNLSSAFTETKPLPGRSPVGSTMKPPQQLIEPALTTRPTSVSTPASSATPRPTRTPLPTPLPLRQSVIASCPVSLPNLTESPNDRYISVEGGFGNPERTMFIGLWPDGIVYLCPDCAGSLSSNGSLGMKFWFYRTIPGEVTIEGQRIDEAGPVAHLATLRGPVDGYGETGFHPAGLVFPDQGCWQVTARIGEADMTFVTLVIWVPFDPLWPSWFPAGVGDFDGPDLSGYPTTFGRIFRADEGGEVIVETSQTLWKNTGFISSQEIVIEAGKTGSCFIQEDNGSGSLIWSSENLNYRIRYDGLKLSCQDLARMAVSPDGDS